MTGMGDDLLVNPKAMEQLFNIIWKIGSGTRYHNLTKYMKQFNFDDIHYVCP